MPTNGDVKTDTHIKPFNEREGDNMNEKFYNFETLFRALRDALRQYLQDNNIYYELSDCFNGWHFEIKCTPKQAENINAFLDTQSFICQ